MNVYISPDVQRTFRPAPRQDSFVSICDTFCSCPPFIIARAAEQYLELGIEIETSGYSNLVFSAITGLTGFYDKEVSVSFRQAEELAVIGKSLLEVHERQPELRRVTTNLSGTQDEWEILDRNKVASIQWLLQVVEQAKGCSQ